MSDLQPQIDQLLADMLENGLPCSSDILIDNRYHRYCYKGTRKKDEFYKAIVTDSGTLYCEYGTFPLKSYRFSAAANGKKIDMAEIEALQRKYAEDQIKQNKQTAEDAKLRWSQAKPCAEHPYLTKKQVKSYGLRSDGKDLLIPIYDINFEIVSLQKIYQDSEGFHKKFMFGGKTWGCFFIIGDIKEAFSAYVVEGYATGASIHEATGRPVIVAFSKGQVLNVIFALRDIYKRCHFYLAGETDKAGKELAKDWEKLIKSEVFMPTFNKEHLEGDYKDFNDISVLYGKEECARQVSLKFYTSVDFLDFLNTNIPPLEWIMPGLIVKGSFVMIYGAAGVGKSRLTYCLAWCLANGQDYKFIKWNPKQKCKVLYVDSEMLDIEVKDYWDWVVSGYKQPDEKPSLTLATKSYMEKNFGDVPNLYNEDHRFKFNRLFEDHEVIFLDNFDGMSESPPDDPDYENKVASFKAIKKWVQEWISKGKTIVMVDHAGKNGDLMGTSCKKRAPQTIISLLPATQKGLDLMKLNVKFEITKGRQIMPGDKYPIIATWDPKSELNPNSSGDPWSVMQADIEYKKK